MNRKAGGGPRSQGGKGDVGKALSLAFEFAGAVFLFWFLGWLVDDWLGIEPWGQVVGALLGWVGGFLHVYYATQNRSGTQKRDGLGRTAGRRRDGLGRTAGRRRDGLGRTAGRRSSR